MTTDSTASRNTDLVLGVLGGGNMGEAILRGLSSQPGRRLRSIRVFDPNAARRAALSEINGVECVAEVLAAAAPADVVLLAVKPQKMAEALESIAHLAQGKLFVSIAAGTTSASLESLLPGGRVVRAMPNTPLMVGHGVVGLCRGKSATAEDLAIAKRLFPGAEIFEVEEPRMDALTAVSGSGPAYFLAFVEALAIAAKQQGFDTETAYRLAAATFVGTAVLLEQSEHDAAELRQRVTSPGGTTAAALDAFKRAGLQKIVADAVAAAAGRGGELSR